MICGISLSLQVTFPSLKKDDKPEESYEAIVVGAGPAGLAAAMYLVRANLKTLVLEAETLGVKIAYPARVVSFELNDYLKILQTRKKEYYARKVLLAMGVQRKKLQILHAENFLGRGVSYCVICDGSFFKGKNVALIGNDDEAITDGLYLSKLVNKIYLVPGVKPPKFQPQGLEKLLSKGNVEHLAAHELIEVLGDSVVKGIKIRDKDGQTNEIPVQGVFFAGEKTPMAALLANIGLETDSSGCIKVDNKMRTNLPGVYASGDITCGRKFQIAVSVGQGVTAALEIIRSHLELERREKT
jgi:thioredoxin reductase (NADPH)